MYPPLPYFLLSPLLYVFVCIVKLFTEHTKDYPQYTVYSACKNDVFPLFKKCFMSLTQTSMSIKLHHKFPVFSLGPHYLSP